MEKYWTMTEYECENCGSEIGGSPFRMTCPECGGRLRNRSREAATGAGS